VEICKELGKNDYSVQLGDCGFEYRDLELVDSHRNRILLGNHENMDTAFDYPHMLGHYGVATLGPFTFFYIRGGFSLDKKYRIADEKITKYKSWFREEELTYKQGLECIALYERIKPDVVLSHDCTADISAMIGSPDIMAAFGYPRSMVTSTQELLQQMADVHQPKLHIFGHYHRNWEVKYMRTHYICVAERQYVDFDESWNIKKG
jgi:hypothetical protein